MTWDDRESGHRTNYMVVDPPGLDENFEVARFNEFLAYALERSETLFWKGRLDWGSSGFLYRSAR